MMQRREFLKGAALAAAAVAGPLAAPSLARAEDARVLRFVPYVDLAILDPVVNTASQTRTYGYLVFDTLYGEDADYQPRPQMVAGHTVEEDGRLWTLTLRDGLRFHDNTPVLARDAAASIRRWAAVDTFGKTLMAAVDAIEAPSDRVVRIRLKRPFPMLPHALGKGAPNMCCIMPERLAASPPTRAVTEVVGSGPFRFLAEERVPGSRAVFARFDGYAPRDEAASGTAGGKRAFVDRVEWVTMPDSATAAAALQRGEVDWWEVAAPDLIPLLRRDRNLAVEVRDKTGVIPILRFNCLNPPFDKPEIRRAVLGAISQSDFMSAFTTDESMWRDRVGFFTPGTPMANEAGVDAALGKPDIAASKRAIAEAGYKGERVVVMGPTDHPVNSSDAQVAADLFGKLGLNVDLQAMDAGTMFQRRANREGVDKGGWSVFPAMIGAEAMIDPATSFPLRANGRDAWFGWPASEKLEALRTRWFDTEGREAQKQVCEEIQLQAWQDVPYAPLGQILQPAAFRKDVTDILEGFAKFWNVRKA